MENENDYLDDFSKRNNNSNDDELHIGLKILAFCIPLAGAIMYFTTGDEKPNKKQQACHSALWGIGFGLVLRIITTMMVG